MAGLQRERWKSKMGVILAVAGSAVGLGNFLRFPAKATANGGGAFMIPYLLAFLLLGIPLIWIEWSIGRRGGQYGHGTAPGIFASLWKHPLAKYLGSIGILGPFIILIYYTYIESWTLGYAYYSFTGHLFDAADQNQMKSFLAAYQGIEHNQFFSGIRSAYIFFVITFVLNFALISYGIRSGIERLSKIAMPILVFIGIILAGRVLTVDPADVSTQGRTVNDALGFVWNPDFARLLDAKVWLEAAGQIFFTLSVGIGVILTYASYLRKDDDVALSGLTAGSMNEFCEVILGGSIVIPAAFLFFGAQGARDVAGGGTFNLGFVTMPLIFHKMAFGQLFCGLWFILLFLAGITSSVSLIQPMMSFLQDEFGMAQKRSVILVGLIAFAASNLAVFFLAHGFLDELDFWGGTVFLVVFATFETILFGWIHGIDNAWKELESGSLLRVPRFYRYVIKYITPTFLITLLIVWSYQQFWPTLMMSSVAQADRPYVWGARIMVFSMLGITLFLIRIIWSRTKGRVDHAD